MKLHLQLSNFPISLSLFPFQHIFFSPQPFDIAPQLHNHPIRFLLFHFHNRNFSLQIIDTVIHLRFFMETVVMIRFEHFQHIFHVGDNLPIRTQPAYGLLLFGGRLMAANINKLFYLLLQVLYFFFILFLRQLISLSLLVKLHFIASNYRFQFKFILVFTLFPELIIIGSILCLIIFLISKVIIMIMILSVLFFTVGDIRFFDRVLLALERKWSFDWLNLADREGAHNFGVIGAIETISF